MGTIGGNLMQQTRCWYYRGPAHCWLKGGETCYARNGENELHAIFMTGESPCVSSHPSDPAAALLALGASIRYEKQRGSGETAVQKLYKLPSEGERGYWRLPQGAVITSIVLPALLEGSLSLYTKAMSRAAWSFALAGVALCVDGSGPGAQARVALSGVAPIPVRATDAERYLSEKGLHGVDSGEFGRLVVAKARPLSQNGYKVKLLSGLAGEALRDLRAGAR
jgi:xanthine dehydrogenase YagS FAD-binding subunit